MTLHSAQTVLGELEAVMEALAHVVEDVVGQQRLLEGGEVRHQELEREAGVVREQLERVTLRWQEVESLNEDMRLERAREALEREQEQEAREREATDIVLLREEARDLRFEQQQEQERQHATAMLEQQAAAAHMLQQQEMQQRETLQQLQGELQQLQARLEEEREEARVRTEELAEILRARDEEVARERAAAVESSARRAVCARAPALLARQRQQALYQSSLAASKVDAMFVFEGRGAEGCVRLSLSLWVWVREYECVRV